MFIYRGNIINLRKQIYIEFDTIIFFILSYIKFAGLILMFVSIVGPEIIQNYANNVWGWERIYKIGRERK